MKQTAITPSQPAASLSLINDRMNQAAPAANKAAARRVFAEHVNGKAHNTERRKIADLNLFAEFLQSVEIPADGESLFSNPQAWHGMDWGIVQAFRDWMMQSGYAVASVNGRLSTVKTFSRLAMQAGIIPAEKYAMIASVKGYANKEKKNVDSRRKSAGLETRKATRINKGKPRKDGQPRKDIHSSKKSEAVHIPDDIAAAMIEQPNTPQGRRDALLMCLLLHHGLRVGEVAILTSDSFNLKNNTITFDRPKVQKTQTHTMTPATRKAAADYIKHDAPTAGIIWRKSHKGTAALSGQLSEKSAERAITKRVELLGRHAGVMGLSAHDCRHYWATYEARKGTSLDRLQDAGGWNSLAMPARYIEAAAIANTGTARIKE